MERETIRAWFVGRMPDGMYTGPLAVQVDRDEIVVVGPVAAPDMPADLGDDARQVAFAARIRSHREATREQRMDVAAEAEARFGRKVAWGATCAEREELFTNASVPVMTRLRLPERQVLDTLIEAGIARSRSEALAWCVRLVGRHQGDWIDQLRRAMEDVARVRDAGPDTGTGTGTA